MKAYVLCLVAVLIIKPYGYAQEKENDLQQEWALKAGVFINKSTVTDKVFSSTPYSGSNPGVSFYVNYRKNKSFHELQLYYTKGALQSPSPAMNKLTQTYINSGYTYLHQLGSGDLKSFIYKAGAGINVLYAKRNYTNFINNNESFEFAGSLSGAFEMSWFFKNKLAGFSLSNRITLPLVSAVNVPAFGGEDTPGSLGKETQIAGFSSFFRLIDYLTLQKEFADRHRLSLSYTWDYYQVFLSREVKQANHCLGLTYSFIL